MYPSAVNVVKVVMQQGNQSAGYHHNYRIGSPPVLLLQTVITRRLVSLTTVQFQILLKLINGSDVDLAVVFSNFLNNQDSKSDPAGFVPSEFSNDNVVDPSFELSNSSFNQNCYDSPPVQVPQQLNWIECERQMDPAPMFRDEFHQQEGITEFSSGGHDPNITSAYRLQDLLSEGFDVDSLMWTSDSSTSHGVPIFSWQLPPKLHGLFELPVDSSLMMIL
ncbi:hypothetical protein BVC80_8455g8 [Macleaya cordata]|uniref:Uncharacterized protein n=1 Tax=Macleaya cordata TaxID=56857 RepID=A0A200R0F6_MACCD|nr:hypothetical protein BVC80_8455g8 [Macleaya cordata]